MRARGMRSAVTLACALVFMALGSASADDDRVWFSSTAWREPPPYTVKSLVIQKGNDDIDIEYPQFSRPKMDAAIRDRLSGGRIDARPDGTGDEGEENRGCAEIAYTRFKVFRASERLLTVFSEGSEEGGCGPPYHVIHAVVLDLQTEEELTVNDLFGLPPDADALRLAYYTSIVPTPEGMVFISSGGMAPWMRPFTFEELRPYKPKMELWK